MVDVPVQRTAQVIDLPSRRPDPAPPAVATRLAQHRVDMEAAAALLGMCLTHPAPTEGQLYGWVREAFDHLRPSRPADRHRAPARTRARWDRTFQRGPRADKLTPREVQVLTGLAAGLTKTQIAARLGTAPATVKAQARSAYERLGVPTAAAAVAAAIREGIIQ